MFIKEDLYQQMKKCFPLPCVDIVVVNSSNEVLLLKRLNEPEKGEWWFPGGRVLHGETRKQAAIRKLEVECGINDPKSCKELKTHDLFLMNKSEKYLSHAITTVFKFEVNKDEVKLDSHSTEYLWVPYTSKHQKINHKFLLEVLKDI